MPDKEGEPQWPRLRFELMWMEHGGCGLGMSYSDVENLDFLEAIELSNMMREQKQKIIAASKK